MIPARNLSLSEVLANLRTLSDAADPSELLTDEYGRNLYRSGLMAHWYRFLYSGTHGDERLHLARIHAIESTYRGVRRYELEDIAGDERIFYLRTYAPFIRAWTPTEKQKKWFPEDFWGEFPRIVKATRERAKAIKVALTIEEFIRVTAMEIPHYYLNELSTRDSYPKEFDEVLKPWIRRLNECVRPQSGFWDYLTTDYRTLSFKLFVQTMKYTVGKKPMGILLWRLLRRKVDVLSMADPEYLRRRRAWVEAKKASDVALCGMLKLEPLDASVLTFATEEGFVARIPSHQWQLSLETIEWKMRWIESRKKKKVPPPPLEHISEIVIPHEEGFDLAPKMHIRCSEVNWRERPLPQKQFDLLIAFCKDMFEQHYTPCNLDPKHLWFFKERLVTTKLLSVDPFCLYAIVDALLSWFSCDRGTYKKAMRVLKIQDSPEQQFFRAVIAHYFENRTYSTDEIPVKFGIRDYHLTRSQSWIFSAAARFRKRVHEYHVLLGELLVANYKWDQGKLEQERKRIQGAVTKEYDNCCHFGIFEDKALPRLAKEIHEQTKKSPPPTQKPQSLREKVAQLNSAPKKDFEIHFNLDFDHLQFPGAGTKTIPKK
ncbi:MAG: hypothetical protein KDK48_03665 [Chlamydiia bacterium]|nr:hypothetical protein [Chlamydiia bacterium]